MPTLPDPWAQYEPYLIVVRTDEGFEIRPKDDSPESVEAMKAVALDIYRTMAARALDVDDDYDTDDDL